MRIKKIECEQTDVKMKIKEGKKRKKRARYNGWRKGTKEGGGKCSKID